PSTMPACPIKSCTKAPSPPPRTTSPINWNPTQPVPGSTSRKPSPPEAAPPPQRPKKNRSPRIIPNQACRPNNPSSPRALLAGFSLLLRFFYEYDKPPCALSAPASRRPWLSLTMIRIVLWWSVFTALTGTTGLWATGLAGLWLLVAVRFLFGMGEAGAYPNITRALHNWFPFRERGLAQGYVWMAGRLMGGLTPLVWLFLIEGVRHTEIQESGESMTTTVLQPLLKGPESWWVCFWVFGLIGLNW